MANRTGELVQQVLEANKLDLNSLFDYAATNISGFPSPPSTFKVSQFAHGQSNPMYLIEVGTGASEGTAKRYVLRKKPPVTLLQSAHAVEREFQKSGTKAKKETEQKSGKKGNKETMNAEINVTEIKQQSSNQAKNTDLGETDAMVQ